MQGYFKMNNDIFDYSLTPNEYTVLAYLYSCANNRTYTVKVKQSRIADKCGIKQISTVSRIISSLKRKGLISDSERLLKRNLVYGTYKYKLKPVRSHSFFCVPRFIIGLLSAVQMRIYLFICKCVNKAKTMWNSYNDISSQLGVRRDKVMTTIKELIEIGLLKKTTVLKSNGSYSDNHYELLTPELDNKNQNIEVEQKERTTRMFAPFGWQIKSYQISSSCDNYKSYKGGCQDMIRKKFVFALFLSGVVP